MDLIEHTKQNFNASIQATREAMDTLAQPISDAALLIVGQLMQGHKMLCCGNGGSASLAELFSSKMLNHFERERPGLPALALTSTPATLTAVANASHFDEIFAKQIQAVGQPGDILIAITSDEISDNITTAIEAALDQEMLIITLSGQIEGEWAKLLRETDIEIRVLSESAIRTQEIHLLTLHCLCDLIDQQLLGS